jgi:hypothetical protein
MAKAPHEAMMDLADAFAQADRNTPRDDIGRARYEMAPTTGMPRSPAQMASVKKAAAKSALSRKTKAMAGGSMKAPAGVAARVPNAAAPAAHKPGVSTGSLSLAKPNKGLLSL